MFMAALEGGSMREAWPDIREGSRRNTKHLI